MQRTEQVLAEYEFFAGLSPEQLQTVSEGAEAVRFEPGETIFRAGDNADLFYLVRHGSISIEIDVPQRGVVSLQTIGEGDVLGWSWLFAPYRWRFDARALEPVRAVALDGRRLREQFERDHDLGYAMLLRMTGLMGKRLQAARFQLLDAHDILT